MRIGDETSHRIAWKSDGRSDKCQGLRRKTSDAVKVAEWGGEREIAVLIGND